MRPPGVGDVIEISTSRGLAYAQIVQKVKSYGPLLRVLKRTFDTRPTELGDVVGGPEQFYVFFPVGAALSRRLVQLAGTVPVPETARSFPLLRAAGDISREGKVTDWWLWDGSRQWRVPFLTADQQRLSIAEIINDTLLRSRIENRWEPQDRS